MKLSRPLRCLLAIASGLALALSFPDYNLPLLAWGAIALLILASVGAGPRDAPLYGFLHGVVFYPTCLPWVVTVMRQHSIGSYPSSSCDTQAFPRNLSSH